mgnify:CR=1 FL=1
MTERIIAEMSLPGIVPLMTEQVAQADYAQHASGCDSCDIGCDMGCDTGCDTGCDVGCDTGGCDDGIKID